MLRHEQVERRLVQFPIVSSHLSFACEFHFRVKVPCESSPVLNELRVPSFAIDFLRKCEFRTNERVCISS